MSDKLEQELYNSLKDLIFFEMTKELERQKRILTGNLVQSFEAVSKQYLTLDFMMELYGVSLNNGVPPSRVPYTPTPPVRGGTSKYIQGLIRWVKLRGIATGEKAKSIAFAIARKQKREGNPIGGGSKFIDIALEKSEEKTIEIIEDFVVNTIMALIIESSNNVK